MANHNYSEFSTAQLEADAKLLSQEIEDNEEENRVMQQELDAINKEL